MESLKSIIIPSIIGIITSLVSGYLFYLKLINLNFILTILIIFILLIITFTTQLNNYEIEKKLITQEKEQNKLMERLKIYEELIEIKSDIKQLQTKVFKK